MRVRYGIDLGGTKIEIIALNSESDVLHRERIATPSGDYAATIQAICDLTGRADETLAPTLGSQPATIGVGIPGTVSPATGLVKNANSTCLIGQPLHRDLEAALGRPVRLANDANCFALSEAVDGSGKQFHSVFGVILGTGVGGGLVIGKTCVIGANAIGGEWGHNPLPWPDPALGELPGPSCYCGLHGCIETFLSGAGLVRDAGLDTDATDAAKRAEAGDDNASAALARYRHRLAKALATVINIFDPGIIVLGGGLSNIQSLYDDVPRLWGDYVFSDTVTTRLAPPAHGDSSGARGAAWLWPLNGV